MFKAKFTLADDVFRRLLKDMRVEKELSQREVARRLKVPQSYISKYETGERRLDFVETVYVCEALGISMQQFLTAFLERLAEARRRRGS